MNSTFVALDLELTGLDPLRDDSIKLAEKLRQSNTPVEFKQVPGVIHSFLHWSDMLPEAVTTLDDIAAFVRRRLPG